MSPHYIALFVAYAVIVVLWFISVRLVPSIWVQQSYPNFKKPKAELIYSLLAVMAILGVGQLFIHDLLVPTGGNEILKAFNQLLIFSPALLLLLVRKQSTKTVWLPLQRSWIRLLIGIAFSIVAVCIYWGIRSDANSLTNIFRNTYHLQNFSKLVQVFLEDLTVALLMFRVQQVIGTRWAIITVAILFAGGHIPSMLAEGIDITGLATLLLDVLLVSMVLLALHRSRDIWWFFPVHFVLDMMQFYGGTGS